MLRPSAGTTLASSSPPIDSIPVYSHIAPGANTLAALRGGQSLVNDLADTPRSYPHSTEAAPCLRRSRRFRPEGVFVPLLAASTRDDAGEGETFTIWQLGQLPGSSQLPGSLGPDGVHGFE
jgi:hypothetical protein